MGGSMPGVPGILTGGTKDLSFGVTYAFVDSYDSWIEQCKDGKYLKEGKYISFVQRKKSLNVKRKIRRDNLYENEHGTLSGILLKKVSI